MIVDLFHALVVLVHLYWPWLLLCMALVGAMTTWAGLRGHDEH